MTDRPPVPLARPPEVRARFRPHAIAAEQLRGRSLRYLARRTRIVVVVSAFLTATSIAVVVAILLGGSRPARDDLTVAFGGIALLSVVWGLGVWTGPDPAGTLDSATSAPAPGRRGIARLAITLVAMSPLVLSLWFGSPRAFGPFARDVLYLFWWPAAAATSVLVSRPAGVRRGLRHLLPPTLVFLLGLVIGTILRGSWQPARDALVVPVDVAAFAAVAVVPTILVTSGIAGLQDTRDRGDRIAAEIDEHRWLPIAVVMIKLGLLVALLIAIPAPYEGWGPGVVSAVLTMAIAGVLVGWLALDQRLALATSEHVVVVRAVALSVGGPLAVVVATFFVFTVAPISVQRPIVVVGLLSLAPLAGVTRRLRSRAARRSAYAAAVVWGVVLVFLTQGRYASTAVPGLGWVDGSLGWLPLGLVLFGLFVLAAVVVIVSAVRRRRFRMLLYVAAVVVWTVLLVVAGELSPGIAPITVDFALAILLAVAACLWGAGLQRAVDGYEIVLTALLTSIIVEVPVFTDLLPDPAGLWVLTFALVAPGCAVAWSELAKISDPLDGDRAQRSLGLTCLTYGLMAACSWALGADVGSLLDGTSSVVLTFLAVPLAVLLVAASSSARRGAVLR